MPWKGTYFINFVGHYRSLVKINICCAGSEQFTAISYSLKERIGNIMYVNKIN